ncbi:DUF31 family putative serine protease [Mesomycoplasma hyorhinis]|uniref:DUF31 domain-containing protein n=1 Tax=Mesomycoplasma hyorhinis SK76 TaxID=1118964 RepID=A0AAI8AMR8_MESHY|nr:hypothetical protein [Mesomycoplasma hyorhinis]AFX74247.1 hypothetical protein MOS_320 [Mesomycoplasma hyorhinis SK76]UVT32579.1 DUF31 family protein [Mesomycoplasma hyorhinis]UVT33919.1 DUF31 family protein [Mesomycoplasma hyorhinis]
MKSKKFLNPLIYLGIVSAGAAAGVGIYFAINAYKDQESKNTNQSVNLKYKNESLSNIINIRASQEGSKLYPSQVATAPNIREYINFWPTEFNVFNYDVANVNKNLKLGYKVIPNSVDDRRGIFKVNISLLQVDPYNNQNQKVLEQKVFTVSGFLTKGANVLSRNDNIKFKDRTSSVLSSIKELKLKQNIKKFDVSTLNDKNFWDYFEIPEGFKTTEKLTLIPQQVEIQQNNQTNTDNPNKTVNVLQQSQEKHKYVILKANENYFLSVLDILGFNEQNKTIQVELGLTHQAYKDNTVAKFLTIKSDLFDFSKQQTNNQLQNPNISIQLKAKYSNFLPSFFFANRPLSTQDLKRYFDITNLDNLDNYQVEIATELNNDQNGTFALFIKKKEALLSVGDQENPNEKQNKTNTVNLDDKTTISTNSTASTATVNEQNQENPNNERLFYVSGFNSYDKISQHIIQYSNFRIDDINDFFNLEDARLRKNALANLNNEVASVSWDFIGKPLKSFFEGQSNTLNLFANTSNLYGFSKSNYYFARTYDYKIEDNKLKFVFVNALNDQYNLYIQFTHKPKANSIYQDADGDAKTSDELFSDLHKRTLAIQYFVKNTDHNNKSIIKAISGTAWVFDRELDKDGKPNGVYYLATNLHVVEEYLKNPSNVFSFAYSLSNKSDTLHFSQENDLIFDTQQSDFRQISKRIYDDYGNPLSPDKYEVSSEESKEFWDNFKVIPLGLNSTKDNKFQDIALIRIKFPKDKILNRGFSLDDIFQDDVFQINKFEKTIQNVPDAVNYYNQHPLKFFISNSIKWPENQENKEISLPIQLYLGGYLSGDSWVEASQSAVLDTKNNFQKTFEYQGKRYNASPSISLPNIYSGHGMSGSLVLNQQGQAVGIFWGGIFPDDKPKTLTRGIGQIDTFGIKIDSKETILSKWLDESKNITTELDKYEPQINKVKQ